MSWFEVVHENWSLEEVVKVIEMTTELYTVNVTYPEYFLSGRSLSTFNTVISSKISSYVGNFTETAEELALPGGAKSELKGTYSTYTAIKRFITVKFDLYPHFGGVHPGHDILTITFDASVNRIISLSDFFGTGNDYLEHLSALVEKALFEKYPELEFAFKDSTYRKGFAPDANNFTHFALTDTGLIIFFREYQVAPYVAGALEVEIPYRDIPT